jgi:hypothetical protein
MGHPASHPPNNRYRGVLRFRLQLIGAGVAAVVWLLLRSGLKPRRLAYPCQQAAMSTAALVFGSAFVGAVVAIRRRLSIGRLTAAGLALGGVGLIAALATWSGQDRIVAYPGPFLSPSEDYSARIFSSVDCPQDPLGDRFICVEDLIEMMGAQGIKLHRSDTTSLTAAPDGIVGADDVVLIKINYQWPERGGTNTDLLRGLIRRILEHPDTFTGEIVVVENTQFNSAENFDRNANNAQDPGLSPRDVVRHFRGQLYKISQFAWTDIRYQSVGEYSEGDMDDGYVVYPYNSQLQGRISYPKFRTAYGSRVSLKHGIWDDVEGYDRERLTFINVPVLKSHHATYGATAMIKHYMGVVSGELATNSHTAIRYGLLGAAIGEIGLADLNLLDAIWINANPYDGPWTTYEAATRTDRLVASLDPVAADLWAVKNILIPAFLDNGYGPPWPYPSADPDDPASAFRAYLDASMNHMLAAGLEVTNDEQQMELVDLGPPGEVSEPGGPGAPLRIAKVPGGYELQWSSPFRGGRVDDYALYRTGLTGNLQAECEQTLGAATSVTVGDLPDGHGLLVVARNAAGEGSFGRNDRGHDRPEPLEGSGCL